jgi:hypothetical protein
MLRTLSLTFVYALLASLTLACSAIAPNPPALLSSSPHRRAEVSIPWASRLPFNLLQPIRRASSAQTVNKQVTLTRVAGPGECSGPESFSTFTASATKIKAGDPVTLSWGAIANADQIRLWSGPTPLGDEAVSAPGSETFHPTVTTKYSLQAWCSVTGPNSGIWSGEIAVTVKP